MDQPKYIDKNLKVPEALDFNFLRTEGIRKIQELTGSFWTDFNLHDPGVTILEQLCYAITDLAYKTDADIEEHIFANKDGQLPFFLPENTLTNRPTTIEDYRKVFIDSIPEIKNIWFEPVAQFEAGFNGLYRIQVDISDYGIQKELDDNHFINKIKTLFSKYRNIGEDIYEIKVLEEIPVKVHAAIETDGIHDLERILAKVYFEIEQIMAPEVMFYSLNELKSKGIDYNNIFNGPRLQHGYILSDDLKPQQTSIIISDIVRSIMQIEGVISVKQLSLEVEGAIHNSQYIIPSGKIPRIITSDIFNGLNQSADSIKFYKGSLEYSGINHKNFTLFLNELVSENKKSFRISESSFDSPKNLEENNFSDYYSIQNHFPAIYGIGAEGIPGTPDTKRIAQSKQLKGYLLIFEQFMANYLSQLDHFKDLLSLQKKQEQTYFTQELTNVPNVEDLLANEKGYISDSFLDLKSVPNNYKEGLVALNKLFDNYTDRRNRFLDYLLAVHGEQLPQYVLQQFNPYYTEAQFDEYLIRCKTALLQNLGDLNYARSSGLNYKDKSDSYLTGLEKRLAIFLGFGITETSNGKAEFNQNNTYFKTFDEQGLKLIGNSKKTSFNNNWKKNGAIDKYELDNENIEKKFDIIDDADLVNLAYTSEQESDITKALLPFKTKIINKSFLVNGINLNNYRIGKVNKPTKCFVLSYYYPELEQWIAIGEYSTKVDAHIAVKILIDKTIQLNINTEGVCMVEHILLRPDPEMNMYGIYINDDSGKHILKSNKQYSLKERGEILTKIGGYFSDNKTFSVEADENRDMNIIFEIKELDLKFISIQANLSVEETHKQKELLFIYLSDSSLLNEKIGFYIQYTSGSIDIPEEFYSFQLSLLFPAWPARFQSKEFQSIANDIVLEQKPANIMTNVEWFEPEEMLHFEKLYQSWKKILSSEEGLSKIENQLQVSKLAEFLYTNMNK